MLVRDHIILTSIIIFSLIFIIYRYLWYKNATELYKISNNRLEQQNELLNELKYY